MGTKVYFFSGPKYFRYDRGDDRVDDGYPLLILGNWPGVAEDGFADGIDAAINLGDGRLFLFKGDKYLRYNITMDRADDGYPLAIGDYWPGFRDAGFAGGIDAAVNWGNGKAYFFLADKYLRYDIKKDRVDSGYPLPIAGNWPGFKEAAFSAVDAAVNWGDGKVYFFRGDKYLRYDINNDKVDDGYPLPIAGNWPGLNLTGATTPLSGAVDLFIPIHHEIWLDGYEVIKSPVNGPKFLNFPWRGVLHTTEGNTVDDAIAEFRSHHNDFPHLTIDPNSGRKVQHISLTIGSRSLGDHGAVTNAANCIQIEIVGKAQNSPSLTTVQLAFIRSIMRDVEGAVPIPRRSGLKFLDQAGMNRNPRNRMTVGQWGVFSGWCGHQHVPVQDHWDPGAIDIDALLKP